MVALCRSEVLQNAQREHSAILFTCIKRFIGNEILFILSSLSGRLRQVLLYNVKWPLFSAHSSFNASLSKEPINFQLVYIQGHITWYSLAQSFVVPL